LIVGDRLSERKAQILALGVAVKSTHRL